MTQNGFTETEALRIGQRIWKQFCDDLADDPSKAKTRLIASIQVALLATPPERKQMIFIPLDAARDSTES
jgi:flagellar biosynthesis regulator FlaF